MIIIYFTVWCMHVWGGGHAKHLAIYLLPLFKWFATSHASPEPQYMHSHNSSMLKRVLYEHGGYLWCYKDAWWYTDI